MVDSLLPILQKANPMTDDKIIEGDFSTDAPKKNKIITENLDDPALKFTTKKWCDTFEMWQYVMWEAKTHPERMNIPDDAMKVAVDISKKIPPGARAVYEKEWKLFRKDIMDFGLHGAEFFTTVCVDGTDGEVPGYEVHREGVDEYLFIPYTQWQVCGQLFFSWYGEHCNTLNPAKATKKLLRKMHGISNEEDFLNSDLGRDGLIANPF